MYFCLYKHLILFCIFLVLLDFQDGEFEELADTWLINVNSERSKCFKDQAKANHEMIRRFSKKHKTAEYKIGEIVYVFSSELKSRKVKKILGKIPAFEGRVIEKKGNEYKIQYETDETKFMVDWFSIRNITNKTKFEDNSRRKKGKYQSCSLTKIR